MFEFFGTVFCFMFVVETGEHYVGADSFCVFCVGDVVTFELPVLALDSASEIQRVLENWTSGGENR